MSCCYPGDDAINALASYFKYFDCEIENIRSPQQIVDELVKQAIISLAEKYPEDQDENVPSIAFQLDHGFVRLHDVHHYAIGLSHFYRYQCCESDAWETSLACEIIDSIISKALRKVVNFSSYWGYQKSQTN